MSIQNGVDVILSMCSRLELMHERLGCMAGHKMKHRLQRFIDTLRIKPWSQQAVDRKSKVRGNPTGRNYWMYYAIRWYPPCCNDFPCQRMRGGQYTKWYDGIPLVRM